MSLEVVIDRLSVDYRDFAAVSDASVEVPAASTLVLLGPSGCGKSSLLNAIAGFVTPSSGRVVIGDRDVTTMPVQTRGVAMVFQSHALFPHLSIADNVAFGLRVGRRRRSIGRAEVADRVRRALEVVRLDGYGDRFPASLSGGERQRVAFARSIVVEPDVLLLDEPLSSLDARLRDEMRLEIREMAEKQGLTMIYVTHDQDEAFALGDLIAVMRRGRIQQIGSPRDIYENPVSSFVASFVGNANVIGCTVGATDETSGTIATLADGTVVRARNPNRIEAGVDAAVAVRAHALRVGDAAAEARDRNRLKATVRLIRYMGSTADLLVSLPGGAELRVESASTTDVVLTAGDVVDLTWRPEDCVLVEAA